MFAQACWRASPLFATKVSNIGLKHQLLLQSLERQIPEHTAELKLVRSEVSWLKATLEVVTRQLSTFQAVFIASEAECDHYPVRIDAKAQRCQDLEELLAEMWRRLDDHWNFLHFSHEMFRYDVKRA